jgi:hypothetical protein
VIALALALAVASSVAIGGGYALQHAAASKLPPLAVRSPVRSLVLLVRNGQWTSGVLLGIGGWALYVVALRIAPLSLVQAASAGGIGVLAIAAGRLRPLERIGVWAALGGLVLLAFSLGSHTGGGQAALGPAAAWLAASAVVAGIAAFVGTAPALGLAAGVLYAAGDVATKVAVGGGGRLGIVPVVLAFHALAFVCMQLAFQRGSALASAGIAMLWTNAIPIVAGTALFAEPVPGGWQGVSRIAAFALVVAGAAALGSATTPPARGDSAPSPASSGPGRATVRSSDHRDRAHRRVERAPLRARD